jgi:hypothetical protein
MSSHEVIDSPSLEALITSDREARITAEQIVRGIEN